ncbi:hypothetical protein E1B28_000705 [Marasmius oreades]|uniref:Uncharacterized protein n=1 Tax=Marasmius oreades TaxID=181124 RepID=A0A9P7V1V8_9AGAR|nr:uncharacterized protein E1B28_000705 [Marasmius oreades]KAG7098800.1 hypothetical protein E1B28_000705 [Marasmius oreades]
MPIKVSKSTAKPSTSRDIISTGPKEVVSSKKSGSATIRPTTERALVLRNGKHGARGTGEVVLTGKMTGSEKLDLLAEDLVEKAQTALRAPFRIEECVEIAISQFNEFIDDVRNLKDPDLFYGVIEEELKARAPQTKNAPDHTRDPTYLASVVSDRIHNSYMIASAWKLVADSLCELEEDGLSNKQVVQQLSNNQELRSRYLALYDVIDTLVKLNQTKFAVLATTTRHYAPYFKETIADNGTKKVFFDWLKAREACRSFLDCIIIELCFPNGTYPQNVLYAILHEAVKEAPKEARRFPQALWDAVGDLAVCVQLRDLIETPLLSPNAQPWKNEEKKMPLDYDQWVDAQLYSEGAAEKHASFKDAIYPLERTKKAEVLANMWKYVNANYKSTSGKDIDTLWNLTQAIKPTPRWHPFPIFAGADSDIDDDAPASNINKRGKKGMLAITNSVESDDSMPPLHSVSDTEESEDDFGDSDDSDSDDGLDDDESGYDTDQEDELRELYKEAMDAVHAVDWNNPEDQADTDYREGNPFLKLLGSLRGRMFQSSTKLKATPAGKTGPLALSKKAKKKAAAAAEGSTSLATTIEEVEDEDEVRSSKKKKKKKPKKKKKASGTGGQDQEEGEEVSVEVPAAEVPKAKTPAPPPPPKPVPSANQSTTSFMPPLEQVPTAQSAHSYIKSEKLDAPKGKLKSRPDHASLFSKPKGVLARLGVGQEEKETPQDKKEKRSFFINLRKKTRGYMHQILHTAEDDTKGSAGMKWETFVKVMEQVGFEVNPSTAGSSVRFTPRNGKDNPISFHKPHPDSTIPPKLLKQYSKRLRDHYGWVPEDLE